LPLFRGDNGGLPRLNYLKFLKGVQVLTLKSFIFIADRSDKGNKKMKKLTILLLSGFLCLGAAACSDNAKTAADAPNSTQASPEAPKVDDVQKAQEDAQSETRRKQANADIKAREERNNALNQGSAENRSEDDIESQVRSKLEVNIPNGELVVKAEDNGAVTVSGTVVKQDQLAKIEPLAKQIKGVKSVDVKATVAAPKAQ
jgi:osmotically-inducible protein OsmY